MARKTMWSWVKRAALLGAAALLVPACSPGAGGNNVQGGLANPLWNSQSTQSNAAPNTGLIWNPAGTVVLPGQGLTGLDVTYSAADPITYPAQNIPNAKPVPIVKSPFSGEPVTTSGVNDPNGYETAIDAMVADQFAIAYPPNRGGVGIGGNGGLGGGIVVQQVPALSLSEPRVASTARGAAYTVRDMGALPGAATLMWRIGVAGGNAQSVVKAGEWAMNGFNTGTIAPGPDSDPTTAAGMMMALANPAGFITGYGTGITIYEGSGFAPAANGSQVGWLYLDLVVAASNPPF